MNRHFVLVLLCFILSIISGFSQKLKPDYQKNSIQIGKTGYYFDHENPFGFGDAVLFSAYQKNLKNMDIFFPYIGYTRRITPYFGIRASIEQYAACYICDDLSKWPPLPLFEIETRAFKLIQFNFLYEFPITKSLSAILAGGGGYRWAFFGQAWNVAYVSHQFWRETFSVGKSFHEWGVGGAIEVKYKFYKEFSLSVKGEYFSFPVRPVRHWGGGGVCRV